MATGFSAVVNRSKGGLGIGLAIVHALAQQHGVVLTAHSPGINQGSVLMLRFPVAEGREENGLPSAFAPSPGRRVFSLLRTIRTLRK